jgi:hypothetical protein
MAKVIQFKKKQTIFDDIGFQLGKNAAVSILTMLKDISLANKNRAVVPFDKIVTHESEPDNE